MTRLAHVLLLATLACVLRITIDGLTLNTDIPCDAGAVTQAKFPGANLP